MNAFAHLEASLEPVPAFHMQARDSDSASEKQRVVKFRQKMRMALPDARIVAVPNAAKRGQAALNAAKAEGAAWGFPDLIVLHDGKVAFLEFKAGRTMPKPHQVDWLNSLVAMGFDAALVRTAGGAMWFLQQKGWPV